MVFDLETSIAVSKMEAQLNHIYYLKKKINQFWREIWIQVLVTLLQLYVNGSKIEKLSGKTLEFWDRIAPS